jgi:hypothetical protein
MGLYQDLPVYKAGYDLLLEIFQFPKKLCSHCFTRKKRCNYFVAPIFFACSIIKKLFLFGVV